MEEKTIYTIKHKNKKPFTYTIIKPGEFYDINSINDAQKTEMRLNTIKKFILQAKQTCKKENQLYPQNFKKNNMLLNIILKKIEQIHKQLLSTAELEFDISQITNNQYTLFQLSDITDKMYQKCKYPKQEIAKLDIEYKNFCKNPQK